LKGKDPETEASMKSFLLIVSIFWLSLAVQIDAQNLLLQEGFSGWTRLNYPLEAGTR
jgi:hypothetical protein